MDTKKEMFVNGWTPKTKYDCSECKSLKTIKHPDYVCKNCGQLFQLKMKF